MKLNQVTAPAAEVAASVAFSNRRFPPWRIDGRKE
jgi:hypothetical protein